LTSSIQPSSVRAEEPTNGEDQLSPKVGELSALIISDLHAVNDQDGSGGTSHVRMTQRGQAQLNPLDALRELVRDGTISADLVLCPGDLTDRADPEALAYAWAELVDIADALGAPLIATTGNHDVDSRHVRSDHDTLGQLLSLDPHFPALDYNTANEFFARQFTTIEDGSTRVLVVDTCHFHRDRKEEITRGRLAKRTVRAIAERLGAPDAPGERLNIVLCHHHPLRWSHVADVADEIEGGERLVALLEDRSEESWLLVHGHRHTPEISYLGVTSSGPVRFAAGSVGAALPKTDASGLSNQIYQVRLRTAPQHGLAMVGEFTAWDWTTTWEPAGFQSAIPHKGGFGFRANGRDLASWVLGLGLKDLSWSDLVEHDARMSYLAPKDLRVMTRCLRSSGHGVFEDPVTARPQEISLK
jgi:predicted phosphodiesterase